MKKAIFYHAGCPVCVSAERMVADSVDRSKYDVEIVHLGEEKSRIGEAEKCGAESVPVLVMDGQAFHINFGASMADVRG